MQKKTTALVAILGLLSTPLLILNILGGLISGIWLIFLGEWGSIFSGILLMIISSFIIGIALMPSMLFVGPAMLFIKKGNKIIGSFFGFLSNVYTMIIITTWCLYILNKFTLIADNNSLIPILIWSYGIALAPWIFLSKKDQDNGNEWSSITNFFAEISYVIAMIMFYFNSSFVSIAIMFSSIMLIVALIETYLAFIIDNQQMEQL